MIQMISKHSANTVRFKFNSKEHSMDLFCKFLNVFSKVNIYQVSSLYRIEIAKFRDVFITRYFKDGNSSLDKLNVVFLSDLGEVKIREYSSSVAPSIPASLHPFDNKNSILRECSFLVFNEEHNIIAWTLLEKIKHNEVGVLTTYVTAPYRATLLGLALWHRLYTRFFEVSPLKNLKWISFYFDINDSQNVKLYQLLFREAEQVNYYCADYML